MRAWRLKAGASSLDDLIPAEMPKPVPGPGEVLIRVRACSLNYRDQLIVQGKYMGGTVTQDITPLSDGAGEVEAIGTGVTQFATGDRVAGLFFQNWLDGPPNPHQGNALGAPPAPGMLADYVVLPQHGVIPMASSLSFEEAATLPCAGVTAWNALMEGPRPLRAGENVLVLGTGGVSLLALQIAKAAGARVIATSSSNAKLERIRTLGASDVINYRETPAWGPAVAVLPGGGADKVIEVGGAGTLEQSMLALRHNAEIAMIGVLSPQGGPNPRMLMMTGSFLRGIFVGSAAMARRLNAAVDAAAIKPVVDQVFAFEDAADAFRYQASPDLFGKVVIRV